MRKESVERQSQDELALLPDAPRINAPIVMIGWAQMMDCLLISK